MRITSVRLEDGTKEIHLSINDMTDGRQEISININEPGSFQNVRLSTAAARAIAEVMLRMTE